MANTKTPTLAHRAQYVALRALIGGLRLVGWRTAGAIGGVIGRLGYAPLGIRRAVVEDHLRRAFPDFTEARVAEVAKASYAHLARVTLEAALLSGDGPDAVFERFEPCTDWPVVDAAFAEGKGVCMVTGHFGNWELAGAYVGARLKQVGSGLDAIVRSQSNPLFEAYINRTREELGMTVVPDAQAVRRTPKSLKRGRGVAFVMDQGVIGLASTYVPFFGRLAKTPRGPAVFALKYQSPVVFAAAIRQPRMAVKCRWSFSDRPTTSS